MTSVGTENCSQLLKHIVCLHSYLTSGISIWSPLAILFYHKLCNACCILLHWKVPRVKFRNYLPNEVPLKLSNEIAGYHICFNMEDDDSEVEFDDVEIDVNQVVKIQVVT